jgi:four helix bundle protein
MATYTSFKELDCYLKSRNAKNWIISFLKTISKNEYDMKDNLLRAARSMTRNIAEGFGRFHFKENIQFVRIARGSATECQDDLDGCVLEGFCQQAHIEEGDRLLAEAIQSMNGYIKYLQTRINNK